VVKLNNAKESLKPINSQEARAILNSKTAVEELTALVTVIADVLDIAIGGEDCYLSLGLNRERSAILLTVTQGKMKGWVSAVDLASLLAGVETLV